MKITFAQIPCDPGQVGVCLFTAKRPEICKRPCRCVWHFCWTFGGRLVNGTRCWPLNSNRHCKCEVASACKFFVYQSELVKALPLALVEWAPGATAACTRNQNPNHKFSYIKEQRVNGKHEKRLVSKVLAVAHLKVVARGNWEMNTPFPGAVCVEAH